MRYIRIYKVFILQYLKTLMEYRTDFFIGMLSFFILQASNLIFISLVFSRIPHLNGWSYNQVLFIYGLSQIPRGLDHLFTDNLWLLANSYVRSGQFDKYLLRPINPLFHLIAERFQPDAFGEIIIGVSIFTYAYTKLGLAFNLLDWLLLLVVILAGIMIYTSIKLIGGSLALWTKRSQHFLFIVYQLADFSSYPMSIFSQFIKMVLTFVIPFAFVAFIPASFFLGMPAIEHTVITCCLVACILWFIAYQIVWKSGLKAYESTGN
ncbi:multidrug ABC transporter permease [Acidaminobacter sp. JC074]|uniref:ABC transporter permease n=1 Tax=Acidaminobacter sp. JC074 TaxID=2530199 RepID=UPI001F102AAD|nr:ABC-2 family transporter protein [Acidaminobacter sp. JC074]MCH4888211.1 multidrug ABC transporter permease [Acidaminobacter sp. JC074]